MTIQALELKKYDYFSSLSGASLEELARKLAEESFPAGALVISEGETGDNFYFVKEGRLEVLKKTAGGTDARISIIGSGQGFGEMALLTGTPRFSSVRALTAVVLYKLMKKDFDAFADRETSFRNMLLKKSAEYLDRTKTLRTSNPSGPDRLSALLARMGHR